MDVVSDNWNAGKDAEDGIRNRHKGDAFSKLAELMAQAEQKQDGRNQKSHQSGLSTCEDCHQDFTDLAGLVRHQQKLHALRKPHRCNLCGQEFALLSSLQLHKCLSSSVCQLCHGKSQRGAPCSCSLEKVDPQDQSHTYQHRHHHDNSPYACAPCGRAFSHKQELLYHQQAGGCQPATLSPKALRSSTAPSSHTPVPTPSYACLPPSPPTPGSCMFCRRVCRSAAGLASHQRVWHPSQWEKNSSKLSGKYAGKMTSKSEKPPEFECKGSLGSTKKSNANRKKGQLFPCRSCDRVFSQTSLLHQHRKEVHRREKRPWQEHRPSAKSTRQRKKGETYPCPVCGKVFLHHLTRWAHLRTHSAQQQNHTRKAVQGVKTSILINETKGNEKNTTRKTKKTKFSSASKTTKADTQKQRRKQETHEEEGEFPCPSCLEVFRSPAALCKHEEVHQPAETIKNCSVCKEEMTPVEGRTTMPELLYHCVPCRQAFSTLNSFLQHCQVHLPNDGDGEDGDSDNYLS